MQNKNKILIAALSVTTLGALDLGILKVENELSWNTIESPLSLKESKIRIYTDIIQHEGTNYTNYIVLRVPHTNQVATNFYCKFEEFTSLGIPDGTNQITVSFVNQAGLESEETERYNLQFYMSKPYAPSKLMLFKYMEAIAELELQKPIQPPPAP